MSLVKFEEDQLFELLVACFRQNEGRMMSLLEAVLPNKEQCEGAKSVARQMIWENHEWLRNHLLDAERP